MKIIKKNVFSNIKSFLKTQNIKAKIILHGSYKRKTCLNYKSDLDIAVILRVNNYDENDILEKVNKYKELLIKDLALYYKKLNLNEKVINFIVYDKKIDIGFFIKKRKQKGLIFIENNKLVRNYLFANYCHTNIKNIITLANYKKIVKIFKNYNYDLKEKKIPSYILESLLFNVPWHYFLCLNKKTKIKKIYNWIYRINIYKYKKLREMNHKIEIYKTLDFNLFTIFIKNIEKAVGKYESNKFKRRS